MDSPSERGDSEERSPPTRVALRAARAGATDDECEALLRAECGLTPTEARRRIVGLGRRLEDARTAGQVAVMTSLQDVAETGEGREKVTAATQLLKHRTDDVPAQLRRLMSRLKEMGPTELAAALRTHLEGLG